MEKKNKKKIAIFVDAQKNAGGVYQELSTFLKNFSQLNEIYNIDFEIISNLRKLEIHDDLQKIKIHYFNFNLIQRALHYLFNHNIFFAKIKKILSLPNKLENFLRENNFDFIIFTSTSQYSPIS